MSRKSKPPQDLSAYMASLGAQGGAAANGEAKRRGGKAHYRKVAEARWGKKRGDK